MRDKSIRTPREGAKVCDKDTLAGKPVMLIKAGKKKDFMTAEEVVEALYGKKVDHIVFK